MSARPQRFEEYAVGAVRHTTGRTITEADIVFHAGQTGDFYPHHMDAAWCATQPFGARIAHGTLVFAVGVGLAAGEINPHAISYGYDRLRFIRPVHIGDTLASTVEIAEARDHAKRPECGIIVERLTVRNQRQEVVLACDHLLLVDRVDRKADADAGALARQRA